MRLVARRGESGGQSGGETDRLEIRVTGRLKLGDRELSEGRERSVVSDSLRRGDSQGLRDLVIVHTVLLITTAPHRTQTYVTVAVRIVWVHYWLVRALSVVSSVKVAWPD